MRMVWDSVITDTRVYFGFSTTRVVYSAGKCLGAFEAEQRQVEITLPRLHTVYGVCTVPSTLSHVVMRQYILECTTAGVRVYVV